MGRKDRYESHVAPKLKDISKWITTLTEGQIAKKLGIAPCTFQKYKQEHPELQKALIDGCEALKEELKDTLRKKAKGYYYTETKTTIRKEGNSEIVTTEEYKKYAQPDTGAIHLLLKNVDPLWHNDDSATLNLKKQELELKKQKQEENNW
ncbi:MAG: hypothetical protein IIV23_08390 [Ruminococcus sp.]|nr:hypothetical protein [Ruminococcus sp.]